MTEDQEVKASDVIDMVIEHLDDVKNLNAAHEDGGYMNISYASHEKNASYAKIQETLDAYVDQRVMSILNKIGLCKSVNPMN